MLFKDYYAVLGVPFSASGETIRSAFKRLALASHPDRTVGADAADFRDANSEEQAINESMSLKSALEILIPDSIPEPSDLPPFTEVKEAYDVLSDVARRYLYDLSYEQAFQQQERAKAEARARREAEAERRRQKELSIRENVMATLSRKKEELAAALGQSLGMQQTTSDFSIFGTTDKFGTSFLSLSDFSAALHRTYDTDVPGGSLGGNALRNPHPATSSFKPQQEFAQCSHPKPKKKSEDASKKEKKPSLPKKDTKDETLSDMGFMDSKLAGKTIHLSGDIFDQKELTKSLRSSYHGTTLDNSSASEEYLRAKVVQKTIDAFFPNAFILDSLPND